LGGQESAAPTSGGAPNGEALVWVVVVGIGFHGIEDSITSF
jgi:hypothetical protein